MTPLRWTSCVRARSLVPVALVAVTLLGVACGGGDPSTPAAADQRPGAGKPYKITVAGDSVALGLGIAMRGIAEGSTGDHGATGDHGSADREGATGEEIELKAIGEDGTGLAREDAFDWPARLAELARDFPPEVLVFSVGSNDAQDLTDPSGTTVVTMAEGAAWDAEYSRRLAAVFDEFRHTGATVVWVGPVRPADETVADTNRHIHRLATEVAATRDWVVVEDLAELTGSGAESTSQCLASDGLHLSQQCYREAAEELLARIGGGGLR